MEPWRDTTNNGKPGPGTQQKTGKPGHSENIKSGTRYRSGAPRLEKLVLK